MSQIVRAQMCFNRKREMHEMPGEWQPFIGFLLTNWEPSRPGNLCISRDPKVTNEGLLYRNWELDITGCKFIKRISTGPFFSLPRRSRTNEKLRRCLNCCCLLRHNLLSCPMDACVLVVDCNEHHESFLKTLDGRSLNDFRAARRLEKVSLSILQNFNCATLL